MSHFILLYVQDTAASAAFYGKLLDIQPVEQSPTFVLYALKDGLMLGLWLKDGVQPAAAQQGGGSEFAMAVANPGQVDDTFARWQEQGVTVLQSPTQMDFGYTFTICDPDQHRIRVFSMDHS